MKKTYLVTLLLLSLFTIAQSSNSSIGNHQPVSAKRSEDGSSIVNFNDYFANKTLRMDYYHAGDSSSEYFYFDEFIEEPNWGGSKTKLIDSLYFGNSYVKVYDAESNSLIYSRGYSTLFDEWQTTDEAKKRSRAILETVVFPFPKDSIRIELYTRNRQNEFIKRFEISTDPSNYFIRKDNRHVYESFKVRYNGDPSGKLDIVFLPDGYTASEFDKFKEDVEKFTGYLFEYDPFDSMEDQINIWGVYAPSKESGIDIPGDSVYVNNLLETSYYTFDSERYAMTYNMKTVRDVAANVPYDQIIILMNLDKYGGGAIYNYYSVFAGRNDKAKQTFIHEFGHGFAGLADEYYTSDVAYNDFYPLDVEPWEENITTLIDFDSKWKDMIADSISIPTPDIDKYDNTIGVFEGAGYAAAGVYRPTRNSIMKSFTSNEFNEVCKRIIRKVLRTYVE